MLLTIEISVENSCEGGNERWGFLKGWEFLDQLSNCLVFQ
jgi:hypothetical protein